MGPKKVEPDWLDDYMSETVEPTIDDFNRLRGEVAKRKKLFESVYRPIRHKLIAHLDKEYIGRNEDLWNKTNIGELEEILWFLNDLKNTITEVYNNGRAVELRGTEPDVDFYDNDFNKLLQRIGA